MKIKKLNFNFTKKLVALAVVIALLLGSYSVSFAAEPLTIVSGGQSDYVIAVPDKVLNDSDTVDESKATIISAADNLGITGRFGTEAVKKVADTDSKVGYAAKITLSKFANDTDRNLHKLPIPLRLYEWDRTATPNKLNLKMQVLVEKSNIDPLKEGTYQLYKGPSFKLPQDIHFTIYYSEGVNAKGQFMPNVDKLGGVSGDEYDIYVSIKFEGPSYITGSTREDAVYIDRVLAVKRVQPTAEDERQNKVELTAAKELQTYIERISGVKLDIVKESTLQTGDKAIMVGHTDFAKNNSIEPTDREEWAIKAIGNKLVITGEGKRGALYGVYHLLEDELGARWWNPWEELVPTNSLIQIDSSIDRSGIPAFSNRHIREDLEGYTPFYARNRMNTVWQTPLEYGSYERWGDPGNSHTFLLYLPPEQYFDEHPEYFSEINGVRQKDKSQICLTNTDVKNIFIEKLRGYIQSSYAKADALGDSRPEFFVICQNDWYGSCTCTNCAAEVSKKGESGLMLTFVNDIADAIKDDYPEVKLETYAYLYTLEAPKDDTKPRDNVVVMFADLYLDILHDLQHGNSTSVESLRVLNDWSTRLKDNNLNNNMQVWYYTLNMGYVAPMQPMFRVAKDFKLYHEKGVDGFFVENEHIFSSDMWDMVEWMVIKLQEDPNRDTAELIKTFTDGYYGVEAGALIREYLSLVANEVEQSNLSAVYYADTHAMRVISVETVLESEKLFEQALEKVKGNTIYTKRLNAARNSLNRYITLQFDYLKQSAKEKGLEFNLDKKAAAARLVASFAEIKEQRVENNGPVKYRMTEIERNQEEYFKSIAGAAPTDPAEDNTLSTAEKATGEIKIDGVLDEANWNTDRTLPVSSLKPIATANIGKTWDNEYLYVAFDVIDPEVKSIPTDNAPYNGDGVEIFIDGDLAKGNYNEHTLHLIFRWNDDKAYNYTAFGGNVKEEIPPEGVQHKMIRTDQGYTAEIAIPWSAIGLNVSEGKTIGFTAHLNDMGTDAAGSAKLLGVRGFTQSLKVADAANSSGWSEMTLTATPDKTALAAKIAETKDLKEAEYTAESWSAMQNVLTAAEAVAGKPDAKQAEVDTALNELVTAVNGLVKVPTGEVEDKVFVSITTPVAITGVANGTAKDAVALGLPPKVNLEIQITTGGAIVTTEGAITWNVGASSYDPASKDAQTFTVEGTVTLPVGVLNPGEIPLTVSISMTVKAAETLEPTPTPTPTPTPAPVYETKVEEGRVTTTIPAKPTTDINGRAVAEISETLLADAITKATAEAAKHGKKIETAVEIKVSSPADAKAAGVDLTAEALKTFVESKVDTLTISTLFGTITFDEKTAEGILKQSAGTITITATKVEATELTEEFRQKVGDRPVVSFDIIGKDKTISQLGGKATVTMPYVLKADENPKAIVAYYINSAGKLETVRNCKYDPASGMITFKTQHFSKYAVGYNKVDFRDVADNAWYRDAVTFATARDITAGVGNENFGSDETVTRVQALVMIMKAFGISPDENTENNFSDAGKSYYTGYLAEAKKLGITSGVGDNRFAPDRQVTRQELFVLVYNTLKNMEELPAGIAAKDLTDFKDAGKVAPYANEAIEMFVNTGIISGTNGCILPEDSASRAQFVQILYNIMTK